MRDRVVLKTVSVSLPFGIGSMSWNTDPTERKAAWSLYVELVTRIAVQPLSVDQGLVREALNSLYRLKRSLLTTLPLTHSLPKLSTQSLASKLHHWSKKHHN